MGITNSELFIGQSAHLQRIFTGEDLQQCMELTKDFNPIYQHHDIGLENGYSQVIIPALLVEGLVTQVITDKLPGCACVLLQKELVYYHPVYIGDEITAELTIVGINYDRDWVTQKVICFNQNGTEVIKGQIVIYVTGKVK
jgi:3-hydroxybutyryl-CoA dehydratase